MPNIDFSYEESLCQQYKNIQGPKNKKPLEASESAPIWIQVIYDLSFGAGYSYSRIAYRINVAPSTIQKIATNPKRKPRLKVLMPLLDLHKKVFFGPYATPRAKAYWREKYLSP